ncbi:hypothetical protein [Pseudoclavibacter helvolus]|uniref:Uncharacterized protein n=1 Tax=Pseudoclavibacter helvolus TaxID=255205 RepID=A0A7W4UNP9_9MICO|nr:hypothetical protein [Pseudoclavibacter helvolus]MBB2957810.1 hypothetical protein [Pseudoclavibacter helvolus]
MTSTQLAQSTPAPTLTPRTGPFTRRFAGLTATQVHAARWRVTGPNGAVRGYVEEHRHGTGVAYAATRMSRTSTAFLTLDEFADFAEAVTAFRYL